MPEWTSVFSGARGISAIYGSKIPSLGGVRVHEIRAEREGPVLKIRFDLSDFPDNPPEKWRLSGLTWFSLKLFLLESGRLALVVFR
jgi:hypothetical protein